MERRSEREVRMDKVHQLRDLGIIPYAQSWNKTHDVVSVKQDTDISTLITIEEILGNSTNHVSLAGRLMLKRVSGKLSFGQLMDKSQEIQLMWEHEHSTLLTDATFDEEKAQKLLGESKKRFDYWFVDKMLDVGDWIGVSGELFVTHKGELTLFVHEFKLLSKAVRPLGDKYHGIGNDQESAYRQRYLDMIFSQESYKRMKFRSDFIRTLREFYWSQDFLEIDCPVLTPAASGAAAKPFKTFHNDFDMDFYLRICNETELKKATIGGFEKVFTLATNFRNEGSDPSHLQEFMMLEHQNVYKNYHEDMTFTEGMFDYIFDTLNLERKIMVEDKEGNPKEVDFTTPWPKIDYVEGVNKASGLDVSSYTIDDADRLRSDIRAKGIEFEGMDQMGTMTLIDYLYKKVLRPSIVGPAFIYNYPSIIAPLARITDEDSNKCEKRQVVVNGWEIINSYGELVDPLRQLENFEEQAKAEADGDEEATSSDMDFVSAMEYGMPIQAGFGMGIERVIAMISQQRNLRDVVMFPLMKPLHTSDNSGPKQDTIETPKVTASPTVDEVEAVDYSTLPSRTDAEALADKYLTDTRQHCAQVGRVMEWFAKDLGLEANEQHRWYITGLLHDLDWDYIKKDSTKHLKTEFDEMMDELHAPLILRNDIKSHGDWLTGVPINSQIRYYLSSIDELSGLIHAYSLMRPEGLQGMKWKSLNKKVKDKKFAAGVDRDHVRHCEKHLGIDLSDFAMKVVEGMKG